MNAGLEKDCSFAPAISLRDVMWQQPTICMKVLSLTNHLTSQRRGFSLLACFLILLGANAARAQGGATVSGHVYCVCDGGPVAGVAVQVGNSTATTDANGFYSLGGVPSGAFTAAASATNYATLSTNLTVVIHALFDATITSDPQAAAITNSILSAVQAYRTLLANSICVTINFQQITNGLGQSVGDPQFVPYTQFLADLQANPNKSPNDTNALAHMPPGPNTGINGNTQVTLTPANLAAIGETALAAQAVAGNGGLNSTISLNISSMNITRANINPNNYDLQGTVLHEVDEALGIGGNGSALYIDSAYTPGVTLPPTNGVGPLDFFRYSAPGVLSFTYDTNVLAYFSINGGNTVLVNFNQSGNGSDGGDWGDGVVPADGNGNPPPQVQDATGSPGTYANLGTNELIALDVAGYSLTPAALAFIGLGQSTPVTTNPAVPVVTWANPVPIVYGTGLGAAQLNATASVPGTFAYSVTNGAVLPAGTNTLSVVFSPTDTTDYTNASAQVTIVVTPAAPVVNWGNPAAVAAGTALDGTELNATANVPGTFAYTPAAGAILPVGPNTLSVVFTPTDTADYTTASAQVTLVVNQGVVVPVAPVITWAPASPIAYGTALGAAQLNATANVAGSFTYSPPAGTVLPVGTNTLSVLFTPTDVVDYTTASAQVALVVTPTTTVSPSLSIALLPGQISVSWPLTAGFGLFTSQSLGSTAAWTAVPADSVNTNQGTVVYTTTPSSSVSFFRLQQQ